ncbi:zinc ribbon domain-containing protein [Halomicroarcula sp. GCM10025709]|uniref:double zinc ribbon domain-containing protein n=1 Tax=Haloarcula TaxID=2237 RepID=UPI0024C2F816|nr:zinc ribbon domain-containing protein [Halomicroarcula sp. YJ-61-S]
MSKITFRADDDLVARLEEFDASKSEVMREALREYLGEGTPSTADGAVSPTSTDMDSIDEFIAERVDTIIADRLDDAPSRQRAQDVNVNITLDGDSRSVTPDSESESDGADGVSHDPSADVSHDAESRKTDSAADETAESSVARDCAQCGETVSSSHVYCPNCGEKASRRVFCECGDELRSDWGFCPSCGRRTPAADVLDNS